MSTRRLIDSGAYLSVRNLPVMFRLSLSLRFPAPQLAAQLLSYCPGLIDDRQFADQRDPTVEIRAGHIFHELLCVKSRMRRYMPIASTTLTQVMGRDTGAHCLPRCPLPRLSEGWAPDQQDLSSFSRLIVVGYVNFDLI